jgi:hypothetical protein
MLLFVLLGGRFGDPLVSTLPAGFRGALMRDGP